MDGHWEWSESGDEPDTGDTADLGGDLGGDSGYGQGFEHGFEPGLDGHDDFGGGDALGGDPHGGDDLEEPLGTEHAAEAYDQSVHDGHDGHDTQDTQDGHDGFVTEDGDPAQHAEFEPVTDHTDTTDHTDHTSEAGDPGDDVAAGGTDVDAETFGTDPDLRGDDGWPEHAFPEELHLDGQPEPVDGFPWSDADVLGGPDHSLSAAYDPAVHTDPPNPADLAGYDGVDVPDGADPWSLLLNSDDPATSSLAGFWAPQN
jgi:hypothetical protein